MLLSTVQAAGMLAALPLGALADRLGGRSSLVAGLLLLALALLLGPAVMALGGWRGWWWALAATSALAAAAVLRGVPPLPPAPRRALAAPLLDTLRHRGPWCVGLAFAAYSSQWLAVIGFLPTVYQQAGLTGTAVALASATAAAANIAGNVASGRLLQRGLAPTRLLATGFGAMAVAAVAAFAWPGEGPAAAALRYAAVLLFSGMGGLIPGTLFSLALRVAPGEHAVASTVGFMQQWSSAGQFAGPPLVAAVAAALGGWQATGLATAAFSALGLVAVAVLATQTSQTSGRSSP